MIASPDLDQDGYYDMNVDCLWTVTVDINLLIRFQVQFVAIQLSPGCVPADFLEVINSVTWQSTCLADDFNYSSILTSDASRERRAY